MAAVQKTVDKWKKKKWFELIAPKIFENKNIGETPAEKSRQVIGRTAWATVDELTGQRKLRHIAVKFKVREVKESKAFTEAIGFEVNQSYLRRMIRRRITKIEAIVTGTTKDGKKTRVSAIAISGRKLEKKKEKAIRKAMTEIIAGDIQKKDFDQLLQELIFGITIAKITKKTSETDKLKKIEIAKARLLEGK
ncbi:MAG: 30S ribosomal protein S3ae [Candidatus Diapherotrites archaeon]